MRYFRGYSKSDIVSMTHTRRFETKVGERLQVISDVNNIENSIATSTAKFVIVGIPEDIGVKANYGTGGTDILWKPFLECFVNIQSNDFLEGGNVLLLGHFDFTEISSLIEGNAHTYEEKVIAYRHAVHEIDEAVEPLIKVITQNNKIPIVIGGGHNNAYPLLKGASKGLYKSGQIPLASLNCICLDAAADFRALEGRHSANAFSYAEEDGYLQKYCGIGIQENHLTQNTWLDVVNNPFIDFITYEDIFIHEKKNFLQAIAHATTFTEDTFTGIEIDLNCIENTWGGLAASGVNAIHARQFVSYTGGDTKTAYLHICEGASISLDGKSSETLAELACCLVSDFIKAKE
jgi:formiminoglutamase